MNQQLERRRLALFRAVMVVVLSFGAGVFAMNEQWLPAFVFSILAGAWGWMGGADA